MTGELSQLRGGRETSWPHAPCDPGKDLKPRQKIGIKNITETMTKCEYRQWIKQ